MVAMRSFNERIKSQQISDLTLHLKTLEKEEQINTKSSSRQEINKIKLKSMGIQRNKQLKKLIKQKVGCLKTYTKLIKSWAH